MSKIYTLASLCFVLIPVISLWSKNIAEVQISKITKIIFFYCVIYGLVYISIFKSFKNPYYVNISIVILFWIFNNIAKILDILLHAPKINVKLEKSFLLITAIAILFINNANILLLMNKAILISAISIMLVYAIHIISFFISIRSKNKNEMPEEISKDEIIKEDCPDIFYIITDAYLSDKALKQYFDFDNTNFINKLKSLGFTVNSDAKSNYCLTNLSIASTLNINYLDTFFQIDHKKDDSFNIHKFADKQFCSFVSKYLVKKGYSYYHIINFWEKQFISNKNPHSIDIDFSISMDFEKMLFRNSLFRFLIDYSSKFISRSNTLKTFAYLKKVALKPAPKFVFAHLLCPHKPYDFDKNGNTPRNSNTEDRIEQKKLYMGQIEYLNKKLLLIVKRIIKHSKNPVIIIQSDHGTAFTFDEQSWDTPNKINLSERFSVFRAIYTKKPIEKFCSNANLFRIIFNEYFNEQLPLLEDKFYFSNYNKRFVFKEYHENDLMINIENYFELLN